MTRRYVQRDPQTARQKDEQIRKLWLNLDITVEAIVERMSLSRSCVLRRVKALGLPTRTELMSGLKKRKAA